MGSVGARCRLQHYLRRLHPEANRNKNESNKCCSGLTLLGHAARDCIKRYLSRFLEAGAHQDLSTMKRIEHAALALNLKGVEIWYPWTKQIQAYKGDTPLMLAMKEEGAITKGAMVQMRKGFTPLHYAIHRENLEVINLEGINLLLEHRAPIEAKSVDGTPLQCAASRGDHEAVAHGAKPNAVLLILGSHVLYGIFSHDCMELLLEANRNKNESNKCCSGLTLLGHAARDCIKRYLSRFLEAGAHEDLSTMKPIEHAALALNLKGVEIWYPWTKHIQAYNAMKEEGAITKGAMVQMWKGFTPLHYAVHRENLEVINLEVINLLLENRAPIEAESVDGTPLQCAASRGDHEAVAHGAKPNAVLLILGSHVLYGIFSHDCMELLLEANPNKAESNKFCSGLTLLGHAARDCIKRYLSRFLEAGAHQDLCTDLVKPIEHAAPKASLRIMHRATCFRFFSSGGDGSNLKGLLLNFHNLINVPRSLTAKAACFHYAELFGHPVYEFKLHGLFEIPDMRITGLTHEMFLSSPIYKDLVYDDFEFLKKVWPNLQCPLPGRLVDHVAFWSAQYRKHGYHIGLDLVQLAQIADGILYIVGPNFGLLQDMVYRVKDLLLFLEERVGVKVQINADLVLKKAISLYLLKEVKIFLDENNVVKHCTYYSRSEYNTGCGAMKGDDFIILGRRIF